MADAPSIDDARLARQWIDELDLAERDKDRAKWLKRAGEIIKLYKEDRPASRTRKRFALFWSNIEVLKPATLARVPLATASRRYKDSDPVGRVASEILERALNFSLDSYDFSAVLYGCRDEFLLLARGVAWVRYIPHFQQAQTAPAEPGEQVPAPVGGEATSVEISDDAEGYEVVDWEEVRADYLNYEDFLHNPARQWSEVRWVARRAFLTQQELLDRFGEKGRDVPLDFKAPNIADDADSSQKKASVYEIWDRVTKRAIWIHKGCPTYPLDARDDPLKLKDFFPCPKPALGTIGPDSIIPVPDYIYYQDQAEEIDTLTTRIDKLIDALRVRGFYSSSNETDLNTLLAANDTTLIPVDSWAALGDKGGLKGIIEWFPVEQIATTLKQCFDARRQVIDDVYQVTGISDIQRGDTDPDETLGAQQLKANYGSARVHERKKELARFARDILQIKAEIIASRFDPQTLSQMTDVQLLTNAEKQQVQQQLQAYQRAQQIAQQARQPAQPGQPPPQAPPPMPSAPDPKQVELLQKPSWDDVMALLQNPALRAFRIDIETDSTIEPNDQLEKQRRIEFVTAVGQYLANSLPVVEANPAILPVITQGLLFLVRGFRVGREMEDTIERAMEQLQASAAQGQGQQQKPGPDPQAEQARAQASVISAQAAQGRNQIEAQRVASDHQIGMAQVQAENNRTTADAQVAMHEAVQKAAEKRLVHEINSTQPMAAATR